MIFRGDAQTSDLLLQGGNLVFDSKSSGTLFIGVKDCASSPELCNKKDLTNIPSQYTYTVGSTAVVNKKTGVVTSDVVSAVTIKCGSSYAPTGKTEESKLLCSSKKFQNFAESGVTCKALPKPDGGALCSASLFVGKDGDLFSDPSSWQGTAPTVCKFHRMVCGVYSIVCVCV